jgi:hypothetical protein
MEPLVPKIVAAHIWWWNWATGTAVDASKKGIKHTGPLRTHTTSVKLKWVRMAYAASTKVTGWLCEFTFTFPINLGRGE